MTILQRCSLLIITT